MAREIASGVINVDVNDADALARLRSLDNEFSRSMDKIDRSKAVAKVDANIAPFEDKVDQARRRLKKLEGQRATAKLTADKTNLDRAIKGARTSLKRLEGEKATVELKVKGERRVIMAQNRIADNQDRLQAAADKSASRAEKERLDAINRQSRVSTALRRQHDKEMEQSHRAALAMDREMETSAKAAERTRMDAINRQARVSSSLRRQQAQEEAAAHAQAIRMDRERERSIYDQSVGFHKQTTQIVNMQRQYAKLTDQAERLSRRRAYTVEGRAKLDLDQRAVAAQMLALKAELNFMGAHPPVDIKIDLNKRGLARVRQGFGQFVAGIAEKASNLGTLTTRVGPFTMTLRQLGIALSLLGPTLTDVVGGLGALIGVAGSGLAGAAAAGTAGVIGMGAGFLGLKFALRNTSQELSNVRSYMDAYQKAVEKYGKNSDKAKAKQEELNHALKTVSPLAREAALGTEKFFKVWDKNTASTQRSMGGIAKGLFGAMTKIAPMWARSTNMLAQNLETSLSGAFKFIKGPEFASNFKAITDNFNGMIPDLMHGLGSFGRGLLNMGREGSKALGGIGKWVDDLGGKFLKFTQRDDFSSIVKRWISDGKAIVDLFGDATSVLVHFFSAGRGAGRGLVDSMDATLERWDKFLTSAKGKQDVGDAFNRAADNVRALWRALAPIAGGFLMWASAMSDVATGLFTVVGWVGKLVNMAGRVAGFADVWSAMLVTVGAGFGIAKIGAFISSLSRVYSLIREIKAASGGLGVLKGLLTGSIFRDAFKGGGGIAGGIETGGAAAAAEMRQGIIMGGTAAAAEIRAAMVGGGAAGGAAEGIGGLLGPTGRPIGKGATSTVAKEAESGAKQVAKFGAAAAGADVAATGLAAAVTGVGLATAVAATGGLALAGAAAYFTVKALTGADANDKFKESLKAANGDAAGAASAFRGMATSANGVALSQAQANMSLKDARAQLKATKSGTDAHRIALLNYRQAVIDNTQAQTDWKNTVNGAEKAAANQIKGTYDAVKAFDKRYDGELKQLRVEEKHATTEEARAKATDKVNDILNQRATLVDAQVRAENRAAATAVNYQRIYRGLPAVLGSAEQALGKLARAAGGKKLSQTIGLKFESPKDVGRVASAASAALKSGVNNKMVMKIVADSKDAESAIRKLNARTITPKKLGIIQTGGEAAINMIEKISGKKLSPKQQKIAESGGAAALGMLARIIARRLPDKSFRVRALDQASGIVSNIAGYIARLHDKTITIRAQHIGSLPTNASGGIGGVAAPAVTPGTQKAQDRALSRLAQNQIGTKSTNELRGGARIQGPRAIYGEEPQHPEFVISTNPSYRKSNVGFLRRAAGALGVKMAASGFNPNYGLGGLTADTPGIGGGPVASVGLSKVGNGAMTVSKKTRKRTAAANKKRSTKKLPLLLNTQHPWYDRVGVLEEQQGLWEREVQFREGNVSEPDDFLNEVKNQAGDVTGYTIDQDAVKTFTEQLQAVKDAYDSLVQVIQDLLTAIPKAYSEANDEITNRTQNIGSIGHAIDQQQKLVRALKKDNAKGKNDSSIKAAEGRIKKYEGQLTKEKAGRDAAKQAKGDLIDKNQDGIFDYKEASRSQTSYKDQIGAMNLQDPNSTPNTQLATATAGLSGSGSGGGADNTGPSYGEQQFSADTEKANILKSFGSNYNPNVGGFGAGAAAGAGAGQNMAQNLASALVGASGGSVQAGRAVMGAMTSGGGAMASSASASRAAAPAASGGGAGFAAVGSVGGSTNVTVNNTFATVPPDPHTWSQGVKFELGAIV